MMHEIAALDVAAGCAKAQSDAEKLIRTGINSSNQSEAIKVLLELSAGYSPGPNEAHFPTYLMFLLVALRYLSYFPLSLQRLSLESDLVQRDCGGGDDGFGLYSSLYPHIFWQIWSGPSSLPVSACADADRLYTPTPCLLSSLTSPR
jgi:hypothetical protein